MFALAGNGEAIDDGRGLSLLCWPSLCRLLGFNFLWLSCRPPFSPDKKDKLLLLLSLLLLWLSLLLFHVIFGLDRGFCLCKDGVCFVFLPCRIAAPVTLDGFKFVPVPPLLLSPRRFVYWFISKTTTFILHCIGYKDGCDCPKMALDKSYCQEWLYWRLKNWLWMSVSNREKKGAS